MPGPGAWWQCGCIPFTCVGRLHLIAACGLDGDGIGCHHCIYVVIGCAIVVSSVTAVGNGVCPGRGRVLLGLRVFPCWLSVFYVSVSPL